MLDLQRYQSLLAKGFQVLFTEGIRSFIRKTFNYLRERQLILRAEKKFLKEISKEAKLENDRVNLDFPENSKPLVSIIILTFNNWIYIYNCLKSIKENSFDLSYEIIVLNNGSTDRTISELPKMKNLKFINSSENLGFVRGCNEGAKLAEGKYLLFLNDDTKVRKMAIKKLIETIESNPKIGAVGAKLIYPGGFLQEAGSIVFKDASAGNYGKWDSPLKPEYSFLREVDYCSGACLLVRKHLFFELGGFDELYIPGYYEDTDLCFSLIQKGYKVVYQPSAQVIHFEGVTGGRDINRGIKKYQKINKVKFREKWKDFLEQQFENSNSLFLARCRKKNGNILVVDYCVPTYDKDSGSLRMFTILEILSELGYNVTFWPDNLLKLEPYTEKLQQIGVEVIYGNINFPKYIKQIGRFLDFTILSRPFTIKYIPYVKMFAPKSKIIYDSVDLHFLREIRRARIESNSKLFNVAKGLKRKELYLASQSDVTFAISEEEKRTLLKENPSLNVEVVSNIHEIFMPKRSFGERKDILFVGAFKHLPNIDSVKYFIKEVFPHIKKKLKNIKFYVVGSYIPQEIKSLNSENVVIVGHVEDLSPYFETARVFSSYLRYGAGVKGKIGQSMSYGLPVVTTSIGAEGMNLKDSEEVMIADEPVQFAEKLIEVYTNESLWHKLSKKSLSHIKENYSKEVAKNNLNKLLTSMQHKKR